MGSQLTYADIAKRVLLDWCDYYQQGGIPLKPLFDDQRQNYLLLKVGWQSDKYIHNAPIHLEIIKGKIWIHHDDTEEGVATDLLTAGVPHDDVVLGFYPPSVRPHTEFAVA